MRVFIILCSIVFLCGCADLPEDRTAPPAALPGKASPLRIEYRETSHDRGGHATGPVEIEASGSFTLDDLLLCVDESPKLAAARERIEMETGMALQGSLAPNPVLRLETEMMPIDDMGFGNARNKVALSQRFETAGKADARVSLALARKDEAEALYYYERNMLMRDVARHFADIHFAGLKAQTLERIKSLEQGRLNQAGALNKQGRLADQDLLAYEIASHEADAKLKDMEAEQRRLLRALEGLMGWPPGTVRTLEGEPLQEGARDEARARAALLNRSCQLVVLDRKRAVALADLDAQERLAYTDLNVGVGYVRGSEMGRGRDDFLGAFVEIPFPLVDRNQGGVQRAGAAVREIEAEMEAEALRLLDDWRGLIEQQRIHRDQQELYRNKIIPLLKRELSLVENQVKAGRESVQRSLEAALKKAQAELSLLDLDERLARIEAQLAFLLGGEFLHDA
ncbi:MAG: TolC family protein [Planctomycetes bacterium]|nr:TolC family protein [Planctomycetota bacterium]